MLHATRRSICDCFCGSFPIIQRYFPRRFYGVKVTATNLRNLHHDVDGDNEEKGGGEMADDLEER